MTTVYHYDSVGNLLKQATQGPVDISFAYSYNKNNAITREERVEGGKATASTYAYDALGQLTAFLSSTGYGESYAYDAVGNMVKKAITPAQGAAEEAAAVTLKMSYNKGNQLVLVANGKDKLTYAYDKNGSMVEKVLSSKEYGKLKDTYAYNSLDQMIGYTGYDGYQQTFTYDAAGMRLAKAEKGDTNRSTLEELLRGNIAGLPEVVAPKADAKAEDAAQAEEGYAWATTEYVYDITQAYYQVIQEKTTGIGGSFTSAYAYGLERIAAYGVSPNGESSKTSYVYDGRGSVAQAITVPHAGGSVLSALPNVQVTSFQYTAFGEQMNTAVKVSGFTYNGERYDAATGILNLRARQYEPAMNRFSQKDKLRGSASSPLSLNRYAYVQNDPINLIDPSGMRLADMQVNGEYYSEDEFHQKVDNLRSAASAALKAGNQQEADKLASRAMSFMESGYDYLTPAQKQAYSKAQSQLATASDPEERKRIIREACMSPQELEAQEYIDQLSQRYTQNEWKFLIENDYINKNMSVESRFAILDHLKKGQGITAEDLIRLGIFTEETRYVPGFLGFRDDVASNTAALLELSYHTTTQFGTTIYELSIQEQQQRNAQIQMLLGYIALQGAMGSVQQYNAAGGAIRYPGATTAAPGYESVPSDFGSFNLNPNASGANSGVVIAEGAGNKLFKNQNLLESHYVKHGAEMQKALGKNTYSMTNYLDDANYIIQNGTYVPELNGYVKFVAGQKYGFVGLDRATSDITTFHIKTVSELIKNAPSLGLGK